MTRLQLLVTALFLYLFFNSSAQYGKPVASVMFYNVENLFDTENDPLVADEEFLPKGERRWSSFRFNTKLNNIAKVIANTGNWEPPAVIGLCEVENRYVLERLLNQPSIRNWKYKIIHKNSPDERGIDVAAIYREDVFYPIKYKYFSPVPEDEPVPSTREILYVYGILAGQDTVHFFFNHWPSRFSGLMETREPRQKAATRLLQEIQDIRAKHNNPLIIIMGDFNDQPDEDSLTRFMKASPTPGSDPSQLYNLSYVWLKQGKGTLKYQSMWNVFDQIIVSGSVLDPQGKLYATTDDATIMGASFLFQKDERYTGQKLFRTYEGFRYIGGYSDHLPIILMIRKGE